jgi:hypothetical protein
MARLIQTEIKQPLANELLFGRLQNGGRVVVDAIDGALTFRYELPSGEEIVESAAPPSKSGEALQVLDGERHDDEELNAVEDPVRDDTGQ